MMQILDKIADAWGWRGIRPSALVMQNEFGNVIVTDEDGRYWRICPEELSCEIVADNDEEFARLVRTEEFVSDWMMRELVDQARSNFGTPPTERCYCLKIPASLGGYYAPDNMATIDRTELIAVSGDLAKQIDGLPDGTTINLEIAG